MIQTKLRIKLLYKQKNKDAPTKWLLPEDDLSAGAEVLAGLGGAFVGAGLQADDALARSELLLCEIPLVLLGGLRAQPGAAPLGVPVRLENVRTIILLFSFSLIKW